MSSSRSSRRRVTGVSILIALACGLTAPAAAQNAAPATKKIAPRIPVPSETTSPEIQPAADPNRRPAAGQIQLPVDPAAVMPAPDPRWLAPGVAGGAAVPAATADDGSAGPDGVRPGPPTALSPDRPLPALDQKVERLGPGGTADRRAGGRPIAPGGAASPTPRLVSGQQRVESPAPSAKSAPGTPPDATAGRQVFFEPTTGQIAEPTEAQLRELQQQQPAAAIGVTTEPVQRPGLESGFQVEVPRSLFPMVTATIAADGQVTVQERQSPPGVPAAITLAPSAAKAAKSVIDERLGPDADPSFELPPTAEVVITIINGDAAGEGFNDPTAVAAVFGNAATTRGAQRLNAFRAAAEYWGGILKSTVPIRVAAQMDSQACTPTSGILGSAGPGSAHRDFTGAPVASTWYVQAIANSRTGADQSVQEDIYATFKSDVDNPTCLGSTSWWYGIGAPALSGTIDFYGTVLHEIGHGIGVLSLVNVSTGAKFQGFDDAYERGLWDWTAGQGWPAMTDAQRLTSQVNTGQLIFIGARATEAARGFLTAGLTGGYPRMFAPNPLQSGSSVSHFDTALTPDELMEPRATPPPGPYAYLTSGLLQDVGWQLLTNGVFDLGASGTWTWNDTTSWAQASSLNPSNLEAWNGNFVGVYSDGTWLRNGTTGAWSQLTGSIPQTMKACGNNLLWANAAIGTWRYNPSTGWQSLSASNPQSVECFGGNMAWEAASGTWLYNFTTSAWAQLSAGDPVGMLSCGSRLVWWRAGDTWAYNGVTGGWASVSTLGPESTACYRNRLVWEGAAGPGTWVYDFNTAGWTQISSANPDQVRAWGPLLVWESSLGTYVYGESGTWKQITTENPTQIEPLGANLIWAGTSGTWIWGGGEGGNAWSNISSVIPTEIVSTGVVVD